MTPDIDTIRTRLMEIVPKGLVVGIGNPAPGEFCVEAAISFAAGEAHGDEPTCVAAPDRVYAIYINDASWASEAERAAWLLPLALASVGTAGTDRGPWARALAEGTVKKIVPIALRAAADTHPDADHKAALRAAADRCEREGTEAAEAAYANAAAADAAADAAYAAADAAYAAADAARDAADAAADAAAAYAADAAAAYAADAADAAARAARSAAALKESIKVALDAYAAEGRDFRYLLPSE